MTPQVQYVSDEDARITSVIVPIDVWHDLQSEKETAYLLKSEAMRERLLTARIRKNGLTLEEISEELDI